MTWSKHSSLRRTEKNNWALVEREGERREGGGREEGRQKRISFGKRERKRGGMGNRVIVRLTMFFR